MCVCRIYETDLYKITTAAAVPALTTITTKRTYIQPDCNWLDWSSRNYFDADICRFYDTFSAIKTKNWRYKTENWPHSHPHPLNVYHAYTLTYLMLFSWLQTHSISIMMKHRRINFTMPTKSVSFCAHKYVSINTYIFWRKKKKTKERNIHS